MNENKIKQEIWEMIQAMNRAWTVDGKPEELKNYFHKNMVAITPTNQKRLEGAEACVASWKAFADSAKINYWKENGKWLVVADQFSPYPNQ